EYDTGYPEPLISGTRKQFLINKTYHRTSKKAFNCNCATEQIHSTKNTRMKTVCLEKQYGSSFKTSFTGWSRL
ncbi:MAG: hypothetical protein ACTSQB_02635, partial [Candidatus Heimdallarchaeota archaeon]